jgi:hypothetical protein
VTIFIENPHLCLVTLRWLLTQYGPALTGEALAALIASEERDREVAKEVYHFGVWNDDDAGHFTHGENGRNLDFNHIGPWNKIDGNLAPGDHYKDVEGATALHHYILYPFLTSPAVVWTAMAFWDRSSDRRMACNTAFFVARKCSFEEMCELAAERYPKQWKRLNVLPFLVKTSDLKWSKGFTNKGGRVINT